MKSPVSKTCIVGPGISAEQFTAEHIFIYMVKGWMSGYDGHHHQRITEGEYCLVRKNRLARYLKPTEAGALQKVMFVFDEAFLRSFQERYKITAGVFKSNDAFLRLHNSHLIPGFIQSLTSYYNNEGKIDERFFDVKREELLLILLQAQPELSGVFFDFGIPAKIDLLEFMNKNYKFNVSIERLAYLTGRSLSAFKRDFKQIFNDTPSHWLLQKRLEEAYFLIEKEHKRPTEFYLDLGFEDLSHFSYVFKKSFGITPTELLAQTH